MTDPGTEAAAPVPILHLSSVIKQPLVDASGDRLGRVRDVIVRVGESAHPPVVGMVITIGGRDLFLPIDKVERIDPGQVRFAGDRVDLRRFERRPGELLLGRDLLARHLINLVQGRLIRANEIELAAADGIWEVIGVDPSSRPSLRRLLPRRVGWRSSPGAIVDWASIEPFVSHVPTSRLRIPYRKLARLHPAQIADLVEAASHDEGAEIIEAVRQDHELEADVFEELDTDHQVEFIQTRTDAEAAQLLTAMAPDDAADLIAAIDQDRRLPILNQLPPSQQRKLRSLLAYNPQTAGGFMSPDFVSLPAETPASGALRAIRASQAPPEVLNAVLITGSDGRLIGTISTPRLIAAQSETALSALTETIDQPIHVHPHWDIAATARQMSDYNLILAPVLDDDHHQILGVVTIDDLIELLLPDQWRGDIISSDNEH
jgi:MgtE intracellular N domain/CBS domain